MSVSNALMWVAVSIPYCVVNAVGLSYLSRNKWGWLRGVLLGVVEYVFIIALIIVSLQAYWVGGEVLVPVLVLFLTIGKSFLLRAFRSDRRLHDILQYLILLIVCILADAALFQWIGLSIAVAMFPEAPIIERRIMAEQFSYWMLTSYPYFVSLWKGSTNE